VNGRPPNPRAGLRALAVLLLAALGCASAQASPLQVRDDEYQGSVVGGQGDPSKAFENEVSLSVFADGTQVSGVIRFVVDTTVEATPVCLRFVADFNSAPLTVSGTGASGSVAVEHAAADGRCGPTSFFEGSQVDSGDFAVAFSGPAAPGTLTIPGDPPLALDFRARRLGVDPPTTTSVPVAGIEEFIDGVALTDDTAARLDELEACTDLERLPGERCDPGLLARAASPFRDLAESRLGEDVLDDDVQLRRAAFIAAMRDPQGRLLCPSLGPMFPVLLAMRQRSPDDPSALNRLVGLLIAMDLDARS
jgi:hypothetical protein